MPTAISWTGETWNPTVGCTRVSLGCVNCYAEHAAAMVNRTQGKRSVYSELLRIVDRDPRWNGKVTFLPERLAIPLRWRAPRKVFVDSMSDLFHEGVTNEQIAAVFGVMAAARQHTFQVLTKRAARMLAWFAWAEKADIQSISIGALHEAGFTDTGCGSAFDPDEWPLPNVWLGVSVENQAAADDRIPELLATPAAVRFLSCEPLIGEVDLDMPRCGHPNHEESWGVADDGATPWCAECDSERSYGHWLGDADEGIKWVIAGCESGPGARACEVAWLRSLRDQCADASVPFFLKQAEESATPNPTVPNVHELLILAAGPGSKAKRGGVIELPYLDGIQHAAFPEVPHG